MFWFICSVSSDESAEKALSGIDVIPFENSDLGDARRSQREHQATGTEDSEVNGEETHSVCSVVTAETTCVGNTVIPLRSSSL